MSDLARDRFSPGFVLTERDIERRKQFVGLADPDIERLVELRDVIAPRAEELVEGFFDYLATFPEAQPLFTSRAVLDQAKALKREHLLAMVGGEYGVAYGEERAQLGQLYSQAGLDMRIFLGAFHHLLATASSDISKRFGPEAAVAFQYGNSFRKLAFFDVGIIVDVVIAERERRIGQQQEAIRELSTPILQIRERLLILPIIGLIDSQRAKQLTDDLLRSIRTARAKAVVMDITGVAAVDSKVANHFIQTVAAARLMGTTVIITGLTPDVAQTLVALGVDLGDIATVGDLQGGLEEAERLVGYKVVRLDNGAVS